MVFEELKAAEDAVILEQPQRRDEIKDQPAGRKLPDDVVLLFLEQSENQESAERRQPNNDREKVVCNHVSPLNSPCLCAISVPLWLIVRKAPFTTETPRSHRGAEKS